MEEQQEEGEETLEAKVKREVDDNELEVKRFSGKTICYGDVVQLKHKATGSFLCVSVTKPANIESLNMEVSLTKIISKSKKFPIFLHSNYFENINWN